MRGTNRADARFAQPSTPQHHNTSTVTTLQGSPVSNKATLHTNFEGRYSLKLDI
jgi:hypothetical protein